jgi:hypothetical protein
MPSRLDARRRNDAERKPAAPRTPPRRNCYLATPSPTTKEIAMNIHVALQPIIALIAGILILIVPRLLNYVVAIYLIIIGLIGLLPILHLS